MRRPLLALAAAFVAGCLAADPAATRAEALVLVGCTAVLLTVCVVVRPDEALLALGAAAFSLGALAAEVEGLRFEAGALRRFLENESGVGQPMHLVGHVRGDARPQAGRLRFKLDVDEIGFRGQRRSAGGRVLVEIGGSTKWPMIVDGERVALWATLRLTRREEGVRRGVVARGYGKSARLLEQLEGSDAGVLRRGMSAARAVLRDRLMHAILPGPERGLVLAMVLGDRSELDEHTAEAFKASGTYHVLALSGAQVALVAALIVGALRWLRVGPAAEAMVTSGAVWFYAMLVGGDVPIVRAALMASTVLAGRAFDLAGDAANLLGLAALVLLVAHPGYAWDVGFQLSFAATLGILVLAGPLGLGVRRLPLRSSSHRSWPGTFTAWLRRHSF